MNQGLHPIQLLPAREYVASALRDAIISQQLTANATLTLDTVSRMLNVSKTPIREAFQTLERDGLIRLVPNKGAIVLGVTTKKIIDCYELRSVLECAAVERICRYRLPLDGVRGAIDTMQRMFDRGDYTNYPNENLCFHQAIWNASDNERLKDVVLQLCSGLNLGKDYSTHTEGIRKVLEQHGQILTALEAYDAASAKIAMRQHVQRSMNLVLEYYGEPGDAVIEI